MLVAAVTIERLCNHSNASAIAALFSEDVVFEIPGDNGVLPVDWTEHGPHRSCRFYPRYTNLTEPIEFNIQDILASDARAVIVGELATSIKATGKVIESAFAIILTVSIGEAIRPCLRPGTVSHTQIMGEVNCA